MGGREGQIDDRQNDEKIGFLCRQEKYLLRARSAFCNPQIMPPKHSNYKNENKTNNA